MICIPLILLSAVQITNHYSPTIDTGCCKINFGLIMLGVLALVYMAVDFFSGVSLINYQDTCFVILYWSNTTTQQNLLTN